MLNPTHRHTIDPYEARDAFDGYVEAVNHGQFAAANKFRKALLALGLVLSWAPGKSARARALAEREARR